MIGIKFLERWRTKWNEINKARSVKYIRRYPKKTGKGYNYVYKRIAGNIRLRRCWNASA